MKLVPLVAALIAAIVAAVGLHYLNESLQPTEEERIAEAEKELDLPSVKKEGPQPKLVVADPGSDYDFGTILFGDTGSHDFIIRNEGEGDLKIKKLFTTCKCTLSEIKDTIIPPGEETIVTLTWDPKNPAEEFFQEAVIKTNDPEYEQLNLGVRGAVKVEARAFPSDVWSVDTITEDTEQLMTVTGIVVSESDEDLEVVGFETPTDAFDVLFFEPTKEQLEESGGLGGTLVRVAVKPTMPVGRFSYPIDLLTNSERTPKVRVSVGGTRTGPFMIIGKGWVGANMRLDAGRIKASEGAERTLTMFAVPSDKPLELVVEDSPFGIELDVERDDKFQSEKREKYLLTVRIPPGLAQGVYNEQGTRPVVTVKSNHPSFDELNFEISLTIE